MERCSGERPVRIQVGGRGKGCGKTLLICRLLQHFPGCAAVKSGMQHPTRPNIAVDSDRFLAAGAVDARFFTHAQTDDLRVFLSEINPSGGGIFLEKNRILDGFPPDLYIFIDGPSDTVRDDLAVLRAAAHFILPGPEPPGELLSRIGTLLQDHRGRR